MRKIKINRFFVILWIINTAIIAINTSKAITMPIISYFIYIIILWHMFVNKGKINISIFFSMLHHEDSIKKTLM